MTATYGLPVGSYEPRPAPVGGDPAAVEDLSTGQRYGGGGVVSGQQLFDLYRQALDEVHFQVQFNWTRIQQLLLSDGVILAAAVGLYPHAGRFTALLFALGVVVSLGAVKANHVQHEYYRRARDRVARFERELTVPVWGRLDSTGTQHDRLRRGDRLAWLHPKFTATRIVNLLFVAIAISDLIGVAAALR